MSYAWELTGGSNGRNGQVGNYPGVKEVWKVVREENLADKINHVKPVRIPTPPELKKAFNKEWTPDSSMSLIEHCTGLIKAYDWALFGLRSVEDIKRVKKSRKHSHNWEEGWQCTTFVGGRAKLAGAKKGNRPWKIWRVCFCPGHRHIRPPYQFGVDVGKDGNPTVEVKWCTVCPLACLEFLSDLFPAIYSPLLPESCKRQGDI